MNTRSAYWLLAFAVLASCSREKELEIDLPSYENKLVVEGYLQPGQVAALLITESVSYFEVPQVPFVTDALVTISFGSEIDTLYHIGSGLYLSHFVMQRDYENTYYLSVRDGKGRQVTSQAKLLPPVPIDTFEIRWKGDTAALVLASFQDPPGVENYYRYLLSNGNTPMNVDYEIDDQLISGQYTPIGSDYRWHKGDILQLKFMNITRDYFLFLESMSQAILANGSPFAEPISVRTNIQGGLGIFAAFEAYQKEIRL